jgi:hypothetical protein
MSDSRFDDKSREPKTVPAERGIAFLERLLLTTFTFVYFMSLILFYTAAVLGAMMYQPGIRRECIVDQRCCIPSSF